MQNQKFVYANASTLSAEFLMSGGGGAVTHLFVFIFFNWIKIRLHTENHLHSLKVTTARLKFQYPGGDGLVTPFFPSP